MYSYLAWGRNGWVGGWGGLLTVGKGGGGGGGGLVVGGWGGVVLENYHVVKFKGFFLQIQYWPISYAVKWPIISQDEMINT